VVLSSGQYSSLYEIQLWDSATADVLWCGKPEYESRSSGLVFFSEEGKYLLVRMSRPTPQVQLIEAASAKSFKTIPLTGSPEAMAFTEHGSRFAVGIRGTRRRLPVLLTTAEPIQDTVEFNAAFYPPHLFYGQNGSCLFLFQWTPGKNGVNRELRMTGWNVETRQVVYRLAHATDTQEWATGNSLQAPVRLFSQNFIAIGGYSTLAGNVSMNTIIFSLVSDSQLPAATLLRTSVTQEVGEGIVIIRDGVLRLWNADRRQEECLGEITFEESDVPGDKPISFASSQGLQHLTLYWSSGKIDFFHKVERDPQASSGISKILSPP
jgi:hypothetical protein